MSPDFKTPREFCEEIGLSETSFYVLAKAGRIPGLIRLGRNLQRIHMPTFLASGIKPSPPALKHSAGGRHPLPVA